MVGVRYTSILTSGASKIGKVHEVASVCLIQEDNNFFELNTIYISSELKASEFSPAWSTSENLDIGYSPIKSKFSFYLIQ